MEEQMQWQDRLYCLLLSIYPQGSQHAHGPVCTACKTPHDGAGSLESVQALVDAGADVGIPAEGGVTGLHAAAELGSLQLVQLLLKVLPAHMRCLLCCMLWLPLCLLLLELFVRVFAIKLSFLCAASVRECFHHLWC